MPGRLAAAGAHLADAEAALAWTADLAWRSRVEVTADGIDVDAAGLPHELARRLLLRAVVALAPGSRPRGAAIERLLARLGDGRGGTLAGVTAARARLRLAPRPRAGTA